MRIERLSDRAGDLLRSGEMRRSRSADGLQRAEQRLRDAEDGYGRADRNTSVWQRLLNIETDEEAAAREAHSEAFDQHRRAYNQHQDVKRRVHQQDGGVR